jgi:hypothetical protein
MSAMTGANRLAIPCGVLIGMLFIVGHDAAHNSLTPAWVTMIFVRNCSIMLEPPESCRATLTAPSRPDAADRHSAVHSRQQHDE